MSDKTPFHKKWISYFIKRDKPAKVVFAFAIASIGILYLVGFNATAVGFVVGVFVGAILFSLASYVFVGQLREKYERKFYDAIRYDCGMQADYQGREMNRIQVDWKGITPQRIHVDGGNSSNLATSKGAWRTVKLSIIDAFNLKNSQVVTNFSNHSQGKLDFAIVGNSEMDNDPEIQKAVFRENLHAFLYEPFASYNSPLPKFTRLNLDEGRKGEPVLESAEVALGEEPASYNKKSFESNFRRNYENPEYLWNFEWNYAALTITRIARGSKQELQAQVFRSIRDLVKSAAMSGFFFSVDDDFAVTPDMVVWGHDGLTPETINVDFMHSDVSRQDKVERFEKLINNGLNQMFKKTAWECSWNIDGFGKAVEIRKVDHPNAI